MEASAPEVRDATVHGCGEFVNEMRTGCERPMTPEVTAASRLCHIVSVGNLDDAMAGTSKAE
jgi:hypothetical protein